MRILSVLIGVAAIVVSGSSNAADLKMDVVDYAPWGVPGADANAHPTGVFSEFAQELSKRLGEPVVVRLTPRARIEQDLQTGETDMTILSWSDNRTPYAEKSGFLFNLEYGVFGKKGVVIKTYDDLKPLKIGIVRGNKIDAKFDEDSALQKDIGVDYETALRKISADRLDAVAGSFVTLEASIKKMGIENKMGDRLVLLSNPLFVHFSKKSEQLSRLPAVIKAIDQMREDGTVDRIMTEHLGQN